ncbi:MAG: hypothetical protein K0S54_350 [Alphaproteobacteria bacterium]|jgi:hypothetical protein|nr:hypothetical protein [Alphaproteobacteria bacterium]
MSSAERAARAARLGDYFELQLRFAEHVGARNGLTLSDAVLRYTNFHRRFGLGDPDRALAPAWGGYAERLSALPDLLARRAWTEEFFFAAPEDTLPPEQYFFGCFGCEAPDARGIVRIHFTRADRDGLSPLHRSKIGRRQAELARLVAFIVERFAGAQSIRGISWLYNIDAYRRLFPPLYGASAQPAERVRLNGTSSWGQFLHHDEAIKPELRDRFLANFSVIEPAAPWRAFPLPALTAQAPLAVFTDFYRAR